VEIGDTLHNEMGANGCPSASVMCPVCVFTHTGLFRLTSGI
jgi:hypothetical protein